MASATPEPEPARSRATASLTAIAAMVLAIASALILGTPTAINGADAAFNPGPAIIGAASVPPAFLAPAPQR